MKCKKISLENISNIVKIIEKKIYVKMQGYKYHIIWVLWNTSIEGNERADSKRSSIYKQ